MPRSPASSLVLLFALSATGALAADACETATTQGRINQCAAAAAVTENDALERAYEAYRDSLAPAQQDRLKRTQLVWRMLREATCDFESGGISDGQAQGRLRSDCLARVTRERAQAIGAWAACRPGAAGCAPLK